MTCSKINKAQLNCTTAIIFAVVCLVFDILNIAHIAMLYEIASIKLSLLSLRSITEWIIQPEINSLTKTIKFKIPEINKAVNCFFSSLLSVCFI
jgi:hypothetical protein